MGTITLRLSTGNVPFEDNSAYRASRYSNALLHFLKEGVIDLTQHVFVEGQITHLEIDGVVAFISGDYTSVFAEESVVYSEIMERFILKRYQCLLGDDTYASAKWCRDNGYHIIQGRDAAYWDVENMDEVVFAADTHSWWHYEDVAYDESTDTYWKHRNPALTIQTIQSAHQTQGLERVLVPTSKVGIGYEIEKRSFLTITGENARDRGDHVGHYKMFRGYEMDGSGCVEAPSNIIPGDLDQLSYVLKLAQKAILILDSPINNNCGGHINISVKGNHKIVLAKRFAHCMPIIYSIWRERFKTPYCRDNRMLEFDDSSRWGGKFAMINMNKNAELIELRIPPAIKSFQDFMWRHRFMIACIDITIIREVTDVNVILEELKPLLLEKYPDNYEERVSLVPAFKEALVLPNVDLPIDMETYFPGYISQERRQAARQRENELRSAILRETRQAVEAGLMNPRRRHRTNQFGTGFTVQCTIGGVRRSRTVRITEHGFTFDRGTQLHVDPQDVDITIMCGTDLVTYAPRRRGGEVISYVPSVVSPTLEPVSVSTNRWSRPGRIHAGSNIWRYYFNQETCYAAVLDGSEFVSVSHYEAWSNVERRYLPGTVAHTFVYNWETNQWNTVT